MKFNEQNNEKAWEAIKLSQDILLEEFGNETLLRAQKNFQEMYFKESDSESKSFEDFAILTGPNPKIIKEKGYEVACWYKACERAIYSYAVDPFLKELFLAGVSAGNFQAMQTSAFISGFDTFQCFAMERLTAAKRLVGSEREKDFMDFLNQEMSISCPDLIMIFEYMNKIKPSKDQSLNFDEKINKLKITYNYSQKMLEAMERALFKTAMNRPKLKYLF